VQEVRRVLADISGVKEADCTRGFAISGRNV
jgi:hypothetical protein